jgi:hypothetical protein
MAHASWVPGCPFTTACPFCTPPCQPGPGTEALLAPRVGQPVAFAASSATSWWSLAGGCSAAPDRCSSGPVHAISSAVDGVPPEKPSQVSKHGAVVLVILGAARLSWPAAETRHGPWNLVAPRLGGDASKSAACVAMRPLRVTMRSCSTASGASLECARKAGCVRAAECGRRPHGAPLHRRAAPPRRPDGAARLRGSGSRARGQHLMALARDRDGDAAPRQARCAASPEMVGTGWSARDGPLAGLRHERQRRASRAAGAGAGERSPVARPATPEEGGPTSDERQPAHTGPWVSGPEARRDQRKPAGKAPMSLPPAERVFREDSLAMPVVGPAREQRQGACCARCLVERIQPCASDTRRGCDEDTRVWSGERLPRRAHRCRARPAGTAPGRRRGRRATRRAPATRLPRL